MTKKKILLVDDDLILLSVAQSAFGEGFDVVTVNSGFDAIEMMAKHSFDLVLLDHQMPILDGFGTLKAIRQFWPDQCVVFCSSTVSEENLRAFSSAGAHGAICKPANITKLPVLVAAFLT